jgi:cytoskeletal protein RodZ
MTKHRTITGLVAVALLLAAAATAATTIRPPSTDRATASPSEASSIGLKADASTHRTEEGQFPRAKKPVRYEAVIANWNRYRSANKPSE